MANAPSGNECLDQIIQAEVDVIRRRRAALNERDPSLKLDKELAVSQTGSGAPVLPVTALALSGGGIRSASFAMGVLQALNERNSLPRIDYLSTVSGGGYMGSALSSTMTVSEGKFEFGETTGKNANSSLTDVKDSPSVGHVRNYSNYLIPFGLRDLLTALAIIVRGLVANVSLVLPYILFGAAVTIFSNPYRTDLVQPDVFGLIRFDFMKDTNFGVTLCVALAAFPLYFIWALARSNATIDKQAEFRTRAPAVFAGILVLIATSFFLELQPFLIDGMFGLADEARAGGSDDFSLATAFVTKLAAIATPIAAVVTIFRQQFAGLLKSVTTESGIGTKIGAYAAQLAIWIAGAAVPLLIWVGFLYLAYWGVVNNAGDRMQGKKPAVEIHANVQIKGPGIDMKGTIDCRPSADSPCVSPAPAAQAKETKKPAKPIEVRHTPTWLINAAGENYDFWRKRSFVQFFFDLWPFNKIPQRTYERTVLWFYLLCAIVLFGISWWLKPNANSLHRLYRDRLSKAFLFDPDPEKRPGSKHWSVESVDLGRDFAQLDTFRISALVPKGNDESGKPIPPYAPYHLINAALNVQGSDYANRRGRNADFFLFSPLYVGSEATGYAKTTEHEEKTGLDLPTAMAISGAAFSSNMGANSIRALTPTLALLNVRTGYWLKNPLALAPNVIGVGSRQVKRRFGSKLYLWSELTGRLYEDSPYIYVTDGGHIENLGIYELLRRRCKVIVVVDAEADPAMRMPSFIALQRYARIDLGVRIHMPWDEIRKCTSSWMGHGGKMPSKDAEQPPRSGGPHAAIGTIDYDGTAQGRLLYIKSSLSGDENDYVRDYARRYSEFPHESTGDQFFSEEQFEVYRALGFHIAARLLSGLDKMEVQGVEGLTDINAAHAAVVEVREALLGPSPPSSPAVPAPSNPAVPAA